MSITFVNIISGVCIPGPATGLVPVVGGGQGQRVADVEERGGDRVQEPRQHQLQPRGRRLGLRRRQPGRELAPAPPHHGANLLVPTAVLNGRIYFEAIRLGNPSKKKCGKFHIWGGGPDPGIFHISKKKWCLKCILSHFKPF